MTIKGRRGFSEFVGFVVFCPSSSEALVALLGILEVMLEEGGMPGGIFIDLCEIEDEVADAATELVVCGDGVQSVGFPTNDLNGFANEVVQADGSEDARLQTQGLDALQVAVFIDEPDELYWKGLHCEGACTMSGRLQLPLDDGRCGRIAVGEGEKDSKEDVASNRRRGSSRRRIVEEIEEESGQEKC